MSKSEAAKVTVQYTVKGKTKTQVFPNATIARTFAEYAASRATNVELIEG